MSYGDFSPHEVKRMALEFVKPLIATLAPLALTVLITGVGTAIVIGVTLMVGRISEKLER